MGHEQQSAAGKVDPQRAAKIVRGIEQLGADATLAMEALSETMMAGAVAAISTIAESPWQVIETDWTARIVCPAWKMARGVGTGDAWLELGEIGPEDVEGFSWISVAVGVGPTRMGMELVFRRGLQELADEAMANNVLLDPLLKRGMVLGEDARLFFPIDIKVEALAQGFAGNDLAKALGPVSEATKQAFAAKAELDALISSVRAAAAK